MSEIAKRWFEDEIEKSERHIKNMRHQLAMIALQEAHREGNRDAATMAREAIRQFWDERNGEDAGGS